MLEQLKLNNLALSEHAELELTDGLICITGETGAGKSLVIDALSLIAGGRADASLVRSGCGSTEISALFSMRQDSALGEVLQKLDFADEDDPSSVLIRRTVFAEGKSRAYVNGRPATLSQLKEICSHLVSVHGQHAGILLTDEKRQLAVVDGFGHTGDLVARLDAVYAEYAALRSELTALSDLQKSSAASFRQERFELEELKKLSLSAGDYEELNAAFDRAMHRSQCMGALSSLRAVIAGGEVNMLSVLRSSQLELDRVRQYSPKIPALMEDLENVIVQLSDCADRASDLSVADDDERPELLEQRMSKIHELAHRFNCAPQDLHLMTKRLEKSVQDFLGLKERIEDLTERVRSRRDEYERLALELSGSRRSAAAELAGAIEEKIRSLALPDAVFDIVLTRDDAGKPARGGRDRLCFMFSANQGEAARPLAQVASGGELSRLALVIEVLTASANSIPTLIFDEIDTGISGRTASAVGSLLKELGRFVQVISVTHLPQVAARADTQYLVSKFNADGRVNSTICRLDDPGRVEEISRMIGGEVITDVTRSSARELLHAG